MTLPIGCRPLDLLLGGGLHRKLITQFYGPAGSGKTNVALQAAYTAARAGKRVVFLDPEGSFHEQRVRQICGADTNSVLKNIILSSIMDFNEQDRVITQLPPCDLVIADSLTSLYRLQREQDPQETNRRLAGQVLALMNKARRDDIPVLITNQVYSDFDTGILEPVGGDVLKYNSKIIVELQKHDTGERRAMLKKHLFKKDGEETTFRIVERGLIE